MSMVEWGPKPRNSRPTGRAESFRYAVAYGGLIDRGIKELDEPVIVAPGCGAFSEARWLKGRLPRARLIGVDYDPTMIEIAALAYATTEGVNVVRGDMKNLKEILMGLGVSRVHFGLFRHPNVGAAGPELLECINQLSQFQAKGDRVFVTTYYESEIQEIGLMLQNEYCCSMPFQNLGEDLEPTPNDAFGLVASKK